MCFKFVTYIFIVLITAPCPVLTQSITACIKELTNELRDALRETNSGVQNIDAKFDRLSQRILAEVESATTIAKEALTIANEAKQEVLHT